MKAVQSGVKEVLEGSKQYVLPAYQRRYSWAEKHWTAVARDLQRLLDEPRRPSHFMGSFVTAPLDHAADQNVNRYRLIDGQQRLTTITLLLCALRDVAAGVGRDDLAGMIGGLYLANPYTKGLATRKLVPTGEDQDDFFAVLDGRPPAGRIGDAYRFFERWFRSLPADQLDAARQAVLGRLTVVSITLETDDDPHLIFESLNAKGERLTQADLLRNYFLMRLPQADADAHFARLWLPMQQALGDDLTGFFRHYLMRDPDTAEVRSDEVYACVKDRIDGRAATSAGVVAELEDVGRHAGFYARLVSPAAYEKDPAVAGRLGRLHRLKVTTAYPFLLSLMDAIDAGRLTPGVMARTLDVIESFLVRRLACGIPTNQLRAIFRGLCRSTHVDGDDAFLTAVRLSLTQKQRCPGDALFADSVVRRPLYGGSKRDVARYLLERIEAASGHKESPDPTAANVQLEHVLPQTLTDAWRAELSPADPQAADELHGQWLHTIGNLTLTGYNPELGNQPYAQKRLRYAESNFQLNGHFAKAEQWNAAAIEARGHAIARHAAALWPDPAAGLARHAGGASVRAKAASVTAVDICGETLSCASVLDAAHQVFVRLNALDPARYDKAILATLSPRRRSASPTEMRAPRQVGDGYVDFHASAERLRQLCQMLVANMGLPASSLRFELASDSVAAS